MKIYLKHSACIAVTILLLTLLSFNSVAQEIPKADNSVHDRMYAMMNQSEKVQLPADIVHHIDSINQHNPYKIKLTWAQSSILKVMHNKTFKKEDLVFFGNEILKMNSETFMPIYPQIKKMLNQL